VVGHFYMAVLISWLVGMVHFPGAASRPGPSARKVRIIRKNWELATAGQGAEAG